MDAPPEELAKGIDPQLQKAVEVLGVEVAEWQEGQDGESPGGQPTPAGRDRGLRAGERDGAEAVAM